MARAIKWTTTFKSINNTTYTVNIYADGWTGSVTALTAATDPFYIEEETDGDLLTVVRYLTGYIRIVADDDVDVDGIFPTTLTERYVEALEGQTVIFRGYVQVQEFSRDTYYADQDNPPQEIDIPIVSPLGLINSIDFDKVTYPHDDTLLGWLRVAIQKLRGEGTSNMWNNVYFPECVTGTSQVLNYLKMSSLTISPLSDDNTHKTGLTEADCFDVMSLGYYIEGLCRCFACIVHETPDALIFSKVDWSGNYSQYILSTDTVQTVQNPGNVTLAPDYVMDGKIVTSYRAPLRKLTCSYEGDKNTSMSMNFQHCRRVRGNDAYQQKYTVVNIPVLTYELYCQPDILQQTCSISATDGVPILRGTYFLGYGEDSINEMVLVSFASISGGGGHNWANGDQMFRYVFYGYFGVDMTLSIQMKWGRTVQLECQQTILASGSLRIYIKNGNLYLKTNGTWSNTESYFEYRNNDIYGARGNFSIPIPSTGMSTIPIEVSFREYGLRNGEGWAVFAVTDLTLSGEAENPATAYINEGDNQGEYVLKGNGIEEEDISLPFACYGQKNSHTLFPYVSFGLPAYAYMFRKRKEIDVTFRGKYSPLIAPGLYMQMTQFKNQSWRVISASYSAWNEETRLIMQTV